MNNIEFQTAIDSLLFDIRSNQNEISALKIKLKSYEDKLSTILENNSLNNYSIDSINEDYKKTSTSLLSIHEKLLDVYDKIYNLSSDYTSLSNDVDELKSTISDIRRIHYDDVEYLKEQIKNCNKDYQPWYKKIFSHEWK